jgi:hypothetical protein
VGCLHQALDVLPADTEARELIYDNCVDILDVHETVHSPNAKQITIQREPEYLTHQLVFKLPPMIRGYLTGELCRLVSGVLF